MNRDWNNSLSGIYNACEYFIYFSNLWIPFERSPFKNISKEKTKDRYFLQSMIEASLFGFISEWLTMETKRGSIHVSLPISLHLPPNLFPKIFTRTSGSWFRLESSRVSSAFSTERSCELSSSRCNPVFALETASLFRDGTSHLAKFEGSSEPARRWFQRCLSERFNRWNCCTVWT